MKIFFFFCFLGPHLQCVEVPRLGVQSKQQLPAYTTVIAMQDLSRICDLHHSSLQCQTLNPLSEARDQTCILLDLNWVHYCWDTMETPNFLEDLYFIKASEQNYEVELSINDKRLKMMWVKSWLQYNWWETWLFLWYTTF